MSLVISHLTFCLALVSSERGELGLHSIELWEIVGTHIYVIKIEDQSVK